MARPKANMPRKKVTITLDALVYEISRYDISNLSAYIDVCLKKHIQALLESPTIREQLIKIYGDDIVYIMRSSSRMAHSYCSNRQELIKNVKVQEIADYKWVDDYEFDKNIKERVKR